MSLREKLARAAQQAEAASSPSTATADPLDAVGKPPPIPTKRPVPTKSNLGKTRSRGRPRSSLPRRELELRPIAAWAHRCLQPADGQMEYIGSSVLTVETTTSGRRVRVKPTYGRLTLSESYLAFCRANGFQPVLPRTFGALVVEACLGFGWPCALSKALDSRRTCVEGVALAGQPPFNGEDRTIAGRADRKRWIPKSKSGQT